MKMNAAFLLMTLTGVWGCAHPAPAHHEHAIAYRGDWTKLGERSVDGFRDRDVIWVGARQGPYRRIMIVVENSPVVPPYGGTMVPPFWNAIAKHPAAAARIV